MIHEDHLQLIRKAIPENEVATWADFGSGWGAFTLALRDIAGKDVQIYSVDKKIESLREQRTYFQRRFASTHITYFEKDFTEDLNLPLLDGIILANSIHYIKDKSEFLKKIAKYLKPNGKIVLVEYNTDTPNSFIPFPISFESLEKLSKDLKFKNFNKLEEIKLDFLSMYSAEFTI